MALTPEQLKIAQQRANYNMPGGTVNLDPSIDLNAANTGQGLGQNMGDQISVRNIDDQGNITGQTGLGRVVAKYGNISDFDNFSPELQAAIQSYQNPIRPGEPGSPGYSGPQGGPGINQGSLGPVGGLYSNEIGTKGPGQPGGIIGLPDMKYKGDSPFGSVINDFYGSGGGRGPMTTDMVYNPFTGQHGSSSQMGEMYDFISGAYGNMQDQMTNKVVKSQDFLDKFNLYGDAMKAYNDYDFMQGITTQGPDGTAQLPGPIMQPATPEPNMPDTTDIFGAGNNPINNPIAPMPSPITPPPTMNSSHSHDDLLQGIGKLFEQYFPQRGGTSTPSTTQPIFDAVGNSAPAQQTAPQVFGNMITPFGRQG